MFYLQGESANPITYDIIVSPPVGYQPPSATTQIISGADVSQTITIDTSSTGIGTPWDDGVMPEVILIDKCPTEWVQGSRLPLLIFQFRQQCQVKDTSGYSATVTWRRRDTGELIGTEDTQLTAYDVSLGQYSFAAPSSWDSIDPGRIYAMCKIYETATPDNRYYPTDEIDFQIK